jgi:DNA repair protein RecO
MTMIRTHAAIVLRPTPFQEGGLVVSFLTELGERLVGLAKGAKKPTAKWVSAFEPLGLVRVSFFGKEHVEIRRITRCELQHSPLTLGHLESNLVVACLADLFDRVAKEGVEDERLFRLLSACGRAIKTHPDRAMAVLAYAEHWLLHCLGLLPHPRTCGYCGNEASPLVMLTEDHGWRCATCTPVDPAEALPLGAREHLRTLRTAAAEDAPDPTGTEAARAVTNLLRSRLLRELGGRVGSYEVLHRMLA